MLSTTFLPRSNLKTTGEREMKNSSSSLLIISISISLVILSLIASIHFSRKNSSVSYPFSSVSSDFSSNHSTFSENPTKPPKSQVEAKVKKFSKLEKLEAGLARARSSIRDAAPLNYENHNQTSDFYVPKGDIYRNADMFHRSYLEMEKIFKIFVYREGDPPLFHTGPYKSTYASEGMFIHQMEIETKFRTHDPEEAHVYFLPFSVSQMVAYLYHEPKDFFGMEQAALDYVTVIAQKYPYWNRSLGADHAMLSCHDWAPVVSFSVPNLYNNSIRVLCNANRSEGFDPSKDASLVEFNLETGDLAGFVGGLPPSGRTVLAFFAGGVHGYIRSVIFEHWLNKDEDIQVYNKLPVELSYHDMMTKSKFCLCPSGYEVASPRVPEAMYAECVPVLISDNFVPPYSDVLNWNSFSIQISVEEIPNLKKILTAIPEDKYFEMHKNVKEVQRHFLVHGTPKRFDVFHMTLHSIWLRRLNIHIHD